MNNEQRTQAGAADLTEKQIAAGAIVRCDHGGSIGRNAAIEVFDAMRAAAPAATEPVAYMSIDKTLPAFAESVDIDRPYRSFGMIPLYAAPVAAQAGQVAVPEWRGIKAVLTNLIAVASVRIADKDEEDEQLIADAEEAVRQLETRIAAAPSAPAVAQQAPAQAEPFDFRAHLARQAAWSEKTFGPGPRTKGVCDHIRKELLEIEADPLDLREWIDVVILGLDGAWRCGGTPDQIIAGIVAKQTKNEGRTWPDWRTADPDKAIEHDRSKDGAQASTPDVRQEGGAA